MWVESVGSDPTNPNRLGNNGKGSGFNSILIIHQSDSPAESGANGAPSSDLPPFESYIDRLWGHRNETARSHQADESDERDWITDSPLAVDALLELIDDIPNVLVLGSPDTAVEYDLCAKLGSADSQPRRRILVSTQKPTVERLRVLDCYDTDSFEETIGIDTGVRDRSHHAESDRSRPLGPETMTIESVRNPRDLTKLGLLINNHLDVSTDGPTTVLCVHSLTTLLNHVKIERLFRFLHVLTGRIRSTQAMGHYHLAPTAHGDEAVQTLQSIFDLTVRFDARGNVSVDR